MASLRSGSRLIAAAMAGGVGITPAIAFCAKDVRWPYHRNTFTDILEHAQGSLLHNVVSIVSFPIYSLAVLRLANLQPDHLHVSHPLLVSVSYGLDRVGLMVILLPPVLSMPCLVVVLRLAYHARNHRAGKD